MPPESCNEHAECKSRIARAEEDIQRIYDMQSTMRETITQVKVSVSWIVGGITAASTILQLMLQRV